MNVNSPQKVFFCGIGGSGMSPLARLLAAGGHQVSGSDRAYDGHRNEAFFNTLLSEGISLFPQNGSGVNASVTSLVVTRAVEPHNPDLQKARGLNLVIQERAALMADLFKDTRNVAVAGTSGKSTTTGMVGYVLHKIGQSPTVVNGATMLNFDSNFLLGRSNLAVFETDESDAFEGAVALCPSYIAILTNISLDHFDLDQLRTVFGRFLSKAKKAVVLNSDCPISTELRNIHPNTITFGIEGNADISPTSVSLNLRVPGIHNELNALAAIAACELCGVPAAQSAAVLNSFRGLRRRVEVVGSCRGVTIVDDFASNGSKIAATLTTLASRSSRLIVVFQPHGFGPTKQLRNDYIRTFTNYLRSGDLLVMPEIYYAGGSGNCVAGQFIPLPIDISSGHIVTAVKQNGRNAHFFQRRSDILPFLRDHVRSGDTVVLMGSRDETLPDFAQQILVSLRNTQ